MKTRILGKTGLEVSEIGMGCWQLGGDFGPIEDATSQAALEAARDAGITFYDTADVYGGGRSETQVGHFLKGAGAGSVVATKVGRTAELYPDSYEATRSPSTCAPRRSGSGSTGSTSCSFIACRRRCWKTARSSRSWTRWWPRG